MHALAQLCIKRPVFATMLIMSLVVVGIFSYFSLGVDLFPKVDIPTVQVAVADPGASPEEIETEITKPIEDTVNTISQIDEVRSVSSEGQSLVIVTFELSKNGDVAAQEVQNKVNLIVNNLPQTAKQPVVLKFDPDAAPVVQIAVSAPRTLRDLTMIADKLIKQKLENAKGVGQITIVGGAKREIHVLVDPAKLRAYNLTVNDVFNALRAQNLELPGGSLKEGARDFTIRTNGRITEPAQFNQIAIAPRNGYVVKVSDVGYAEDSYEEPTTAARLDGVAAVTLIVSKQSGENTVATARDIKERLAEITPTLPKDVQPRIVADQSVFIEAAVNSIKHHLVLGSFFASIVIFMFLANWRTTLIASIAIPTSIISAFALMAAMGLTMNQITMLALTLMVGIVIDDAIIVLENIFRFMEEKGMGPFQAAVEGTREIGLAVMATTLSLLAVFLPVGFMGGIVGRFMSSFGFTASFAIAVSLLVSFTMTPMLTSRFVKPPSRHGKDAHSSKESSIFHWIDVHYTRMLRWAMAHRGWILGFSALTILSIVPLFMFVGKNFLPSDDQSQFNVLVRTPEGTSLAATTAITEQIAHDIRELPGVLHTLATVGGTADKSANNSTIYVKLTDIDQRHVSQVDLMQQTRQLLKKYPREIHSGVELVAAIGGNQSNAEIQFYIQGPDLAQLAKYSDTLLAKMKAIPGVADPDSTLRSGKPEVRLVINRARAADLGVSVMDIEQALNTLVAGQVASTFNAGEDQYDVRVRAAEEFRTDEAGLASMTVPSSKRGSVGLDEVVDIKSGSGPSSVNRINRQRQVTLTCNTLPGGSQAAILGALQQAADDLHMGSDYRSGRTGASKELARTGLYFLIAFSLTFIFMYIVLAAQFESFIHPVTILLTLPLAIPFGILSLLIAHQTVNIFSGLGLLLLFGIVKKNAILQIDHTNGLRAAGYTRYDAIMQANRDRLRPILMTTIALVAGMLPLVMSGGTGSATNRSIGVLVVGGQSLCLLLTLLAVPVFYSVFEDMKSWRPRFLRKKEPVAEEVHV
jgi:HAE1 family hydrophobic/amphiphilic exporter-1